MGPTLAVFFAALWLAVIGPSIAQRLWPYGVVPYTISPRLDIEQRKAVLEGMDTIQSLSCIGFVPFMGQTGDHESPRLHIRLARSGGGCWTSFTGFSGGRQTLTLEPKACFSKSTILHELMHVLGFLHEHNRPDRDDHVLVIWDRVPAEKRYAFKKRSYNSTYFPDRLTPYDHRSILHYSEYAFTARKDSEMVKPTMISKKGLRLGGAKTLSPMDVYRLNRIYNCKV